MSAARPQEALWVTALQEPDGGLPGVVYETTREKCYRPLRRRAMRRALADIY